jgi:phosphohistidine phosphatase SixA
MSASIPPSKSLPFLLRLGVSLCFIGHGAFGFLYKEGWVAFFTYFGISRAWVPSLERVIGMIDLACATISLLFPFPAFFAYAAFWTVWTAFLRPLTGLGWWEFFERAGNFGVPLAVLALYVSAASTRKQWFTPRFPRLDADRHVGVVTHVLQITTVLLLLGHGGLALAQNKPLLGFHMGTVMAVLGSHVAAQDLLHLAGLIDVSGALAVLCYPTSSIFLLTGCWKMAIESLYPFSGDYTWEFIERFGSYTAPFALFVLARAYPAPFYRHCLSVPNFGRWLVTQHQQGLYRSATWALALGGGLCLLVGFSLSHHRDLSPYSLAVLKPKAIQFLSGPPLLKAMTTQPALIYFRHFPTQHDPRRDDPKSWFHGRLTGDDFADCSWQRELHPYGRALAYSVGAQFATLSLKIHKVLASPYCRCIESARLMTGLTPEVDLGLIYHRAEQTTERMESAFQRILLTPENFVPGRLTVVVGHRPVLDAFGEVAEGDAVVFIHEQNTYSVVGKIAASEWLATASDLTWLGHRASSGYTGH